MANIKSNKRQVIELLKDEDFGGYVNIEDLGYKYQGASIDYVFLTIDNQLQYWGGDPMEDNNAEELLITPDIETEILQDLVDMYC